MDWLPIESAPKDEWIIIYREARIYVAKWMDRWNTWGVSAERVPGKGDDPFADVGPVGFGAVVYATGPSHWMPLPPPPEG